jgi:hypothetical protein
MGVSRRTRCNFYAIVEKSNSGKITSAVQINWCKEDDIETYEGMKLVGC